MNTNQGDRLVPVLALKVCTGKALFLTNYKDLPGTVLVSLKSVKILSSGIPLVSGSMGWLECKCEDLLLY